MLRKIFASLLLFWILQSSHAAAQSADVVGLATKGNYPPWNFVNASGALDGFERDLGDELCRRAGLTCEWVLNDWGSIIPNLVSGRYDAIISGMAITPERAERIGFTQPYTPPDSSRYMALSEDVDLDNAVIAAQAGTIQAAYLEKSGAALVEFPTHDETLAAVESGEAQALLANVAFLEEVAKRNDRMVIVGDPVALSGGAGIGLRKSDVALREKFDAAIRSMKDDGSLNELIGKWDVSNQW